MIAGTWRGTVAAGMGTGYVAIVGRTGLPDSRATPGNVGLFVMRRPVGDQLRAWLLVTTRHLATDRFRAIRRRALAAPRSTTLDEASRHSWLDVRAAMACLSPLERTALVLTAVEGVSYTVAAEMLGTSAGALRSAVSRARDKLEVA